jgi:hypothetical protein
MSLKKELFFTLPAISINQLSAIAICTLTHDVFFGFALT